MFKRRLLLALGLVVTALLLSSTVEAADIPIPGTGEKIKDVGDDFEDEKWKFIHNYPKSSSNIDHFDRLPAGMSENQLWYESTYRGEPDIIERVKTPKGGLPGSKGALLLRTANSGIPNHPSYEMQQDDFLANISHKLGGHLPTHWRPNFHVRVFLPEFKVWEKRTGSTFAVRADVEGVKNKSQSRGFLRNQFVSQVSESYWPGMFIQFNRKQDGYKEDHAIILVRSDEMGRDIQGPTIKAEDLGWWTFGMSFTPDGRVHYFASKGIDELTIKDHLGSYVPYGMPCQKFNTLFFNVVNMDNGKTWSTPWIIDDPEVFYFRK